MATYTATGTGSPVTVTGLPAGNYRFTVKATNSSGGGVASAQSATVTTTSGTSSTGDLYTRCAFGAYATNGGTADHAALEATVGAKLKRYVTYQNMGTGGSSNWPSSDASWCASTGHTLNIAWDMPATGITYSSLTNGSNDASLDSFFQACRSYGGQVILRMWWEMNCTGGPTKPGTGGVFANAAQWIAGWQYVYNRCKVTNGCTNVNFFWCANGGDVGSYTMEQLFPGASYVDEVGFDTYNETTYGTWGSFSDRMEPAYDRVTALHPTAPVSIGEIGTVNNDPGDSSQNKATWLTGLFTNPGFPRLKHLDFFSVDQSPGGNNWRIDETAASVAVCQQYLPLAPS